MVNETLASLEQRDSVSEENLKQKIKKYASGGHQVNSNTTSMGQIFCYGFTKKNVKSRFQW